MIDPNQPDNGDNLDTYMKELAEYRKGGGATTPPAIVILLMMGLVFLGLALILLAMHAVLGFIYE